MLTAEVVPLVGAGSFVFAFLSHYRVLLLTLGVVSRVNVSVGSVEIVGILLRKVILVWRCVHLPWCLALSCKRDDVEMFHLRSRVVFVLAVIVDWRKGCPHASV